VSTLIFIQ